MMKIIYMFLQVRKTTFPREAASPCSVPRQTRRPSQWQSHSTRQYDYWFCTLINMCCKAVDWTQKSPPPGLIHSLFVSICLNKLQGSMYLQDFFFFCFCNWEINISMVISLFFFHFVPAWNNEKVRGKFPNLQKYRSSQSKFLHGVTKKTKI